MYHGALGSLRHRASRARRHARRRPHLQRRLRQRVGLRRGAGDRAGACARAGSKPRALDLLRVHDRRGVGPAGRASTSPRTRRCRWHQVAANINIDGVNYLGPTKDIVLLGAERSTLGPMAEALAAERGRDDRQRPAPGARVLLPLRSLPARQGRRAGACRSASRSEFTGANAAALLAKQEAYNGKDYHQPSDEFDPAWDFSGGVEDMRAARAARLAHRRAGRRCRRTTTAISSPK